MFFCSPGPRATSPGTGGRGAVPDSGSSVTPTVEKKEERDETGTPSSSSGAQKAAIARPSTPPPRQEAFEDFKKDIGSEINRYVTNYFQKMKLRN